MKKVLIIFLLLFITACAQKSSQTTQNSTLQNDNGIVSRYTIKNSGKAPANLDPFIDQNASKLGHFAYKIKLDEITFINKFFSTWKMPLPALTKKNQNVIFWSVKRYGKGYDENGVLRPKKWFINVKENANIKAYAKVNKKALTTEIATSRLLPTNEPLYPNKLSAEQKNFDDLQESYLGAFSPVVISHFSKDNKWAFVRTDAFFGWIESEKLLVLGDIDAHKFLQNKFGVFIKDNEKINAKPRNFTSRIGGVFPYTSWDRKNFKFSGKIADKKYDFVIKDGVGSHFLQINNENLKNLANNFIGQEYGWGGTRGLRDCSLFIKDFFAVFGKHMPRNSQSQGNVGNKVDISHLSNEGKKMILNKKALLLSTLLIMPGHVMLYAGNSEAIHNVWGIRTENDGRSVIGKTAITDLEIAKGYEDVKDSALLLSKIKSINLVVDPAKIALERAYNVNIDKKIRFDDGYMMDYENPKANHNDDIYSPSSSASVADMLLLDYPLYAPLDAPRNDAGRIRVNEFFSHIYGENESEVEKNLVAVTWLKSTKNQKIMFNHKNGAAAALQRVSDELDALSKKNSRILKHLEQSGTFKWRKIAKSDNLSPHSWAIALDIDVENSSYWQWHKEYKNTLPKEIVEIFERNGFIWGGRWERFDTMHFEYRPEYIMLDKLKERQ